MCNDVLYSLVFDACLFNLPGVTQMKYTLAKWCDAFPALEDYDAAPTTANALTFSADITLDTTTYTDAAWFDCSLEIDENDFATEFQGKPGSGYYVTTMNGFIPTSSRDAHWALHKTNKSDLIIAVLTRNEEWRIIGRPQNPAQLAANYSTGKVAPDKAGFTLVGTWAAHAEPAPFYDGTF